ncbi:MAG: hypothetical protein M3P53_00550 [Actinomycetota bacterium]|nr:hypothetical protein [Actinomycetota bacterium]
MIRRDHRGAELAVGQQPSLEDEKNSSTWFSHDAWVGVKCRWTCVVLQDLADLVGDVCREVVDDAVQVEPRGGLGSKSARKSTELSDLVELLTHPATVPRAP